MTPEGQLDLPGNGSVTTLVCAGYDYDLDVGQPLMSLLPRCCTYPQTASPAATSAQSSTCSRARSSSAKPGHAPPPHG